jgi:hypothetical protein
MSVTDPAPLDDTAAGTADDPHAADDLSVLREVIALAFPDAVPELIRGDDVPAMLASIPEARAAFARVIERVPAPPPGPAPAPVPAGSAVRSHQPDVSTLSPLARIRLGLVRD